MWHDIDLRGLPWSKMRPFLRKHLSDITVSLHLEGHRTPGTRRSRSSRPESKQCVDMINNNKQQSIKLFSSFLFRTFCTFYDRPRNTWMKTERPGRSYRSLSVDWNSEAGSESPVQAGDVWRPQRRYAGGACPWQRRPYLMRDTIHIQWRIKDASEHPCVAKTGVIWTFFTIK